ncbi:MAG TPA: ABC transporter ATP-binding protein [Thermoanaerobaculia bacterium]|nr:ABC transporter ATP-binding protein [Thermoanaerobaculia bacterium]
MLQRLAYLVPYFRRHLSRLVWGVLTIVVSVIFGLITPLLVGHGIDSLRASADSSTILRYALLIFGVSIVQGIFTYLQRTLLVTMSRDVEFDLRNEYFAHLEKQPQSFFHQHPTGDLMARATNDLQAVRMLCGPAVMYSINTVLTAAGSLVLMARIDLRLTLLSLVTMPVVAAVTQVFGSRIHSLFEKVQGQFSAISARVQENLAGVRVVRAYAQEEPEQTTFGRLNDEYVEGNRRLITWTAAFHPLLQALIGVGFSAVLWYGGLLVIRHSITVGQFVTFNAFVGKLIWPMIALGWVINLTQRGTASLGRIRRVLEIKPAVVDEAPLVETAELQGAIRCRNLTFSYSADAEPVLADIDFQIEAGATVALVGRTGSGKSTLLSLLPRLYNPPEQSLAVDGIDVRRLPLAQLRGVISMVPQETFLFSATVAENISLGRPQATREEIREAARQAGLEEDLSGFPQGLETVVGERGLTLSGGQKQRVALARALLREPRILLLDDCLSAVDTQTEERILSNLRQVFLGRTVFLVSHRISTVKDADLILVLDRGRIAERGTHEQLTAAGGLYADLHQRQMLEEELAAV